MARRLIVTADDFGRSMEMNEAVEGGYRDGVLTAASLMVTGAAAADAVERAWRLPGLGTGLHVSLVDATPALPPGRIPDLVGPDGRFTSDLARVGAKIFLFPSVRAQARDEMRAQFEAYRATGLPLDHVDSHHHYHLHPTIFALLIPMARDYGAKGLRIPFEPPAASWRARREGLVRRWSMAAFLCLQAYSMRFLARRHGLAVNDAMFGLHDSGAMTVGTVTDYLAALPDGLSELYCHPATAPVGGDHPMPAAYRPVDEYRALIDPAVMRTVREHGITLTTFTREAG